MIKRMLVFDMDGTIADLYGVENWLDMLDRKETTPFQIAKPMYNMEEMRETLLGLKECGCIISVVTWLPKEADRTYKRAVAEMKQSWLEEYSFPYDDFHAISYGACKRYPVSPRKKYPYAQLLFDDNEEVRKDWSKWHGNNAVDAEKEDILEVLKGILESYQK